MQSSSMVYDYFDKLIFLCQMYDEEADEIRKFVLLFFPFDNSVQIVDTDKEKVLLKRVQVPTMKLEMLQIGNVINVFSKLLQITDCAPATRTKIFKNFTSTFALIKPVPASEHGKILTFITMKGFRIVQMKNGKVDKDFGMELYKHISGNNMLPIIVDYITSGDVIGLELVAENAVPLWRRCLGATEPKEAEPGTLRYLYGQSKLKNIAHGCDTAENVSQAPFILPTRLVPSRTPEEGDLISKKISYTKQKFTSEVDLLCSLPMKMIESFFGATNGIPNIPLRATFKNCTLCIIKPHAIIEGNLGSIVEQISTSNIFEVTAMAMFTVKLQNAKEFYEIYYGVLPEYQAMSIYLAEGKCVALEVKCLDTNLNSVEEFRKLCGPRDPDVCRQLYPTTIRALYGKNIVHNAVHCTDLPEDGELEVEYFFKLLSSN